MGLKITVKFGPGGTFLAQGPVSGAYTSSGDYSWGTYVGWNPSGQTALFNQGSSYGCSLTPSQREAQVRLLYASKLYANIFYPNVDNSK